MKRGVATITVYVYGETDQELIEKSNELCELFQEEHRAEVEELGEVPFGKIGNYRKIK